MGPAPGGSVQGASESIRFASAYSRTLAKIDPCCGERGLRTSDDLAAAVGDPDIGGVVTDYPKFDVLKSQLESFATGEAAYPVSPEDAFQSVAALKGMFKSGVSGKPTAV